MFLIIYNVSLTDRNELISTGFLVMCFHLWGGRGEKPPCPIAGGPAALHAWIGAAGCTAVRTTRMPAQQWVSPYPQNKKSPWICMKSFSTLGLALTCSSLLLFCLHGRHECSIHCISKCLIDPLTLIQKQLLTAVNTHFMATIITITSQHYILTCC